MNVFTRVRQFPKAYQWTGIAILAAIVIAVVFSATRGSGPSDLPSFRVEKGNFRIEISETGELRAQNSLIVSAPPVRTNLQIVYVKPKGTYVSIGDTLIVFDSADLLQRIDERQSELEIAQANLAKSRSSLENQLADLRANLKSTEASYRIAELRLSQMEFEADIVKEEQQLSLLQSKISLEKARSNITQQEIMNTAELKTLELKVQQAQNELEKTTRDLDKLTVTAQQPGLVVYKKIWKGGDFAEIKVGDTPWRGQALIELPDLSIMEIETMVNEVDVAKMDTALVTTVIPDAFPDRHYMGRVIDVASLARIDEESEAQVKVFDVVVELDSTDSILKPGMTVSATILVKEIPDVLFAPLDAVFNQNGENIVYMKKGGWKPVHVELGDRNDDFVVITAGLKKGDRVALIDPTKPFDPALWQNQKEDKKKNGNGNGAASAVNGNSNGE